MADVEARVEALEQQLAKMLGQLDRVVENVEALFIVVGDNHEDRIRSIESAAAAISRASA